MSKWSEWKKSLGDSRPWHLLDPENKVRNQAVIDKRLEACITCEFFLATKQCAHCKCYMPVKATLSNAECPIGKWGKEFE